MNANTSLPFNAHKTNYVPSPEEYDLVKSLILLHKERSLALDAEVERARTTLQDLLLEQQVQRDLIEAHKALLTPMRRIIPDVLLEIFRHCHDGARDAPMCLARVCKQWRELVLSTPTLWTIINLHSTFPTMSIVPFTQACVKRSSSCDLAVSINLMTRRADTQRVRRALQQALNTLVHHAHRLRSFEVLLHKLYKPADGDIATSPAPRLKKLVWIIDEASTPFPFPSLPNLRELRVMLHPRDIPVILQCTKLRRFTARGPQSELTLMDCYTILSNCSSLETFEVLRIKASQIDLRLTGTISLPCLCELRMGPFALDPAPLVYCLNTPALKHLRLLANLRGNFDSSCIRHLVHTSRPPLKTLSLVNVHGADITACLPLLPGLNSLLLQHPSAADLVINQLLERDTTGHFLCPDLKHLGFRMCLFAGSQMIKLAKIRRTVAGGLRVLVGEKPPHPQDVFEGLVIELDIAGDFTDAELIELRGLQTEEMRRPKGRVPTFQVGWLLGN